MLRLARLPPSLRVLAAPAATFLDVATAGRGFGALFGLLALEYLLVYPGTAATHLARLPFAPVAALSGVWSSYLHFALTPAVFVFVLGLAQYYALRLARRPRLDVWSAASVLAYAWVPHLIMVALGVVTSRLVGEHPLLPQVPFDSAQLAPLQFLIKTALSFGPSAAFAVVAARALWTRQTEPTQSPVSPRRALMTSAAASALLLSALALNTQHVTTHWQEVRPLSPGDALPSFVAAGLDTPALEGSALVGQVVLVDFWATWCPPCVASMPHLEVLHHDLGPRGFHLVSINVEPEAPAQVREFLRKGELHFPVYVDGGALQQRFRVQNLPSAFLIDAHGTVREVFIGAPNPDQLRRRIEALLDERERS